MLQQLVGRYPVSMGRRPPTEAEIIFITRACVWMHMYHQASICTRACVRVCVNAHVWAYFHSYTHTRTYSLTHTHTHTHRYTCWIWCWTGPIEDTRVWIRTGARSASWCWQVLRARAIRWVYVCVCVCVCCAYFDGGVVCMGKVCSVKVCQSLEYG
jgi:hypothetical protein